MRGISGSTFDTVKRPIHWVRGREEKTGVLEERLSGFFERYERDAYLVLRRDGLDSEQRQRGVNRMRALVGKAYDYDFSEGDDKYYCSELVVEFLEASEGQSPTFETVGVHVPLVLKSRAIKPIAFLTSGEFSIVTYNDAVRTNCREILAQIGAL